MDITRSSALSTGMPDPRTEGLLADSADRCSLDPESASEGQGTTRPAVPASGKQRWCTVEVMPLVLHQRGVAWLMQYSFI